MEQLLTKWKISSTPPYTLYTMMGHFVAHSNFLSEFSIFTKRKNQLVMNTAPDDNIFLVN